MDKVVASIEARMGSRRLPGKVLMDVAGAPALTRLLRRLRRAKRLDGVVLATTENPADDALVEWATRENVACFRGSEEDVLARVVGAQRMMGAEVVVEVCGDMPLLDPAVIDMGVEAFAEGDCDVVTTTSKRSFPDGVDAQVFRLKDLEEVADTVSDPEVREHVSLHFYQAPKRYRLRHLEAPPALRRPDLRLVLDTADDLELIRRVFAHLEPAFSDTFGTADVIRLLDREPDLLGGAGGKLRKARR